MKCFTIWQDRDHRWLAFAQDPDRPDTVIDTNQLVVTSEDAAMLLDPGGIELFPAMAAAVTQEVGIDRLRHLFLSHQDPDVASALPLWRQVCATGLGVHVSWMWTGFLSHFDSETKFTAIPDHGAEVHLSRSVTLHLLPAHYLHSPGCFCVYDPAAKVLFSGDIGAALVPPDQITGIFVEDFDAHVAYMDAFHRRWMGSGAARDRWVEMVRRLDVEVLAPQHGLFFRGADVTRFLDWLSGLELGSGLAAYDQVTVGR
ncbi:MAG: MBL fold metallo-hydrolase [Actinomycetota bacterium]